LALCIIELSVLSEIVFEGVFIYLARIFLLIMFTPLVFAKAPDGGGAMQLFASQARAAASS
jgi:hypothetical protein